MFCFSHRKKKNPQQYVALTPHKQKTKIDLNMTNGRNGKRASKRDTFTYTVQWKTILN